MSRAAGLRAVCFDLDGTLMHRSCEQRVEPAELRLLRAEDLPSAESLGATRGEPESARGQYL